MSPTRSSKLKNPVLDVKDEHNIEPMPEDPIPELEDEQREELCKTILSTNDFETLFSEEYVDKTDLNIQKEILSNHNILKMNYSRVRMMLTGKSTPNSPSTPSSPVGESSTTKFNPSTPIDIPVPELIKQFSLASPPNSPPARSSPITSTRALSPPTLPLTSDYEAVYPYDNQYVTVDKNIGSSFEERMFPCLAREKSSRIIVQHFIAFGHKTNIWLVFNQDEKGLIFLQALAEALPDFVHFENTELEKYYAEQRDAAGTYYA